MCIVCLALYSLRPRERTASEGPPKRGRRSFRASAEVPGGVRDDGAGGGERAPKSAAAAQQLAEAAPLPRAGYGSMIIRASLGPRPGGWVAATLLFERPKSV
jgi:hypothetical protein